MEQSLSGHRHSNSSVVSVIFPRIKHSTESINSELHKVLDGTEVPRNAI